MSTILVTGGAGYIGSHVCRELFRQGHQPIIYDNLQSGHRKAAQGSQLTEGDLADGRRLREVFQSFSIDSVMHFAADCSVGESVENPLKYFRNNIKNSLQLLEIMMKFGVTNFIFSSSAAVYGEPHEIPVSEEHSCLPLNPYGETKWVLERVLQRLQEAKRLEYISLRYFNAAGADPDGEIGEDHSPETHLIPISILAAMSGRTIPIFGTDYDTPDGTCIRDYIHATDLARAHILALNRLASGGSSAIYNLGNGNGYSVKEVIETVREVTGMKVDTVESPRRPGDPARLVAASGKIQKELGWVPHYPDLSSIVNTAWQWHRRHPKGYEDKL